MPRPPVPASGRPPHGGQQLSLSDWQQAGQPGLLGAMTLVVERGAVLRPAGSETVGSSTASRPTWAAAELSIPESRGASS